MSEFSVDYDGCQILLTDRRAQEKRLANFALRITAEVEAPPTIWSLRATS